MPLRRLAQTTVVAACIFLSGTEPAPCIDTARDVTSTADAQNLADDLNCTGEGEFNVIWYGNVAISQTFYVSDGISLNVTGKNSSILSLDGDEGRGTIVGDGITSETGIFFVSGSSTLTLSNLVLQGGNSTTEYGSGAVEAQGSADANQTVNLIDCLFTNNTGFSSGVSNFPYDTRMWCAISIMWLVWLPPPSDQYLGRGGRVVSLIGPRAQYHTRITTSYVFGRASRPTNVGANPDIKIRARVYFELLDTCLSNTNDPNSRRKKLQPPLWDES